MTRFKLPEALGGGTYEAVLYRSGGVNYLEFDVPDVGQVTVPMAAVTEGSPPEPPVGAFVACGGDGNLLPFYRRWHEGWSRVDGVQVEADVTWDEICAESEKRAGRPPVRLVPAPEPVELPWHCEGHSGERVSVEESQEALYPQHVFVSAPAEFITPDNADAMAAALTTAARIAREATS